MFYMQYYLIFLMFVFTFACSSSPLNHADLTIFKHAHLEVDTKASEIIFPQLKVKPSFINRYKHKLTKRIEKAVNPVASQASLQKLPIRYRVDVLEASTSHFVLVFPCLIVMSIYGCPSSINMAKVKVSLDISGVVYHTNVKFFTLNGLYYDHRDIYLLETAIINGINKLKTKIQKQFAQ